MTELYKNFQRGFQAIFYSAVALAFALGIFYLAISPEAPEGLAWLARVALAITGITTTGYLIKEHGKV